MPEHKKKKSEAQFIKFFGPLLDSLRKLGGSGTPAEVVEQIVKDLEIPEIIQNEIMASGEARLQN